MRERRARRRGRLWTYNTFYVRARPHNLPITLSLVRWVGVQALLLYVLGNLCAGTTTYVHAACTSDLILTPLRTLRVDSINDRSRSLTASLCTDSIWHAGRRPPATSGTLSTDLPIARYFNVWNLLPRIKGRSVIRYLHLPPEP
jgi:hypothetical protein